jgi:CBS domain-containing protein
MVDPDLPVQDLLAVVTQTGARKFLVVRDHRLLGVVTLADLAGSLQQADMRLHERDVPQR